MLDGIGLRQDEDFKSIYLDRAGDGPLMVQDGRAAALWGAGIGWPGFEAMAKAPGGARFIAPDANEIARVIAKHAFLKPMTVPAGSYPNQSAAISSLGSWSFVLARADLPDGIAYRLARALRDDIRHDAVDANGGNHESEHTKESQKQHRHLPLRGAPGDQLLHRSDVP